MSKQNYKFNMMMMAYFPSIIFYVGSGSSKRRRNSRSQILSPGDKTWLVNHTSLSSEQVDKLFKEFGTDYPNGGIYRKFVRN